MSKGAKQVLGLVAAVAIPFVAPAIAGSLAASAASAGWAGTASFLSGAGGAAATGAVLGGLTSAATGGNPLMGAALGGLGGYAGGGGFQQLFGGPQAAAGMGGAPAASLRPMARPDGLGGGLAGGLGAAAPAAAAAAPAAGLAAPAATAAAPSGLGGFFRQVGQGLLSNPAGIAQLAMTVFGRPPQQLTSAEQAQLDDLRRVADQNMQLFETQVTQANNLLRMAGQQAPNPQQAFAETKIAAERQLGEQTRGLGVTEAAFAQRRAGIRSAQAGATAAAAEEARGRQAQTQLTQAGISALPSMAPQGYAGLAMPTFNALQERRDAYNRDLAQASGDLFGSIG
jgi:hypothetical protein